MHQKNSIDLWRKNLEGFLIIVKVIVKEKQRLFFRPHCICQSPTKIDVVSEVLKQCKQKAEALNLNETDLVLDHAIYAKAVEIVMKEKFTDLRTFINIRMGGFHAASIFLGVIGRRFKDAGLKDLIIV